MDETMQARRDMTIINELGLHARAAAAFVKVANRYNADIKVFKESMSVNGKSIMGVLMLAAGKGSVLTVEANGDDANDALAALDELVSSKFGEPS